MRRQGLGRGLAAILPGSATAARKGEHDGELGLDAPGGVVPMNVLSDDLATTVATSESGIALIYKALDALVDQFELDDAAVVIDEPGMGRQVFCAGRRPLAADDEELLVSPPGLYTRPALDNHGFDRSLMLSLCVLALRLDVLRYDAWHDPLTGLYDRRSFDRLLEMSIARCNRYGWPFTLVMLDLDHFKIVNDEQGHQAGDQVLRDLGERFRRALRFGDNAGRIGGDEFAMILPNTEADLVPALLDRVRNADGLRRSCPAFSFGVAQCPQEATEFDELVQLADARLYEAKEAKYGSSAR
ncbi:MAG TPA: GGDEF domain-containing protein [Acidimicrobiia bacterium]|nr:GGDEF domain-containing protein [Acidimicrobiia bacterium]